MTALTVDEVAAELRVSAWWVRKQVKLGVVAPLRVGPATNARGRATAPMRFTDEHVRQLVASMQPAPLPARKRRRRSA